MGEPNDLFFVVVVAVIVVVGALAFFAGMAVC